MKRLTGCYTIEEIADREEAWWDWHDKDDSRGSATVEEAEARAKAWAMGQSDDGPFDHERENID